MGKPRQGGQTLLQSPQNNGLISSMRAEPCGAPSPMACARADARPRPPAIFSPVPRPPGGRCFQCCGMLEGVPVFSSSALVRHSPGHMPLGISLNVLGDCNLRFVIAILQVRKLMPREGKWVAQENGLMSVRGEAGAVCAEGRGLPNSPLPVDFYI